MPIKEIELTKSVAVRLTPALYRLIEIMRPVFGSDADVMRAAILALYREYQSTLQIPSAAPEAPAPDAVPATPEG